MSLADSIIAAGAPAYNFVHCDTWTILGPGALAGVSFRGDAQTEQPMMLETDIGSDGREKTVLYVDRPAPALNRTMRISGKGVTWQVVGDVDDNPANERVKFELMKVVEGKDS